MLTFLLYTVVFWFAGNCVLKIFYFAIQPEQALDMLFNWQRMLNALYESNNKAANLLGKALGDCQMCMSYWFMNIWFVAYAYSLNVLGAWAIHGVLLNVIWYFVFHSIGTIAGLLLIGFKFKKHKK